MRPSAKRRGKEKCEVGRREQPGWRTQEPRSLVLYCSCICGRDKNGRGLVRGMWNIGRKDGHCQNVNTVKPCDVIGGFGKRKFDRTPAMIVPLFQVIDA